MCKKVSVRSIVYTVLPCHMVFGTINLSQVTRLVPYLEPEEECMLVPREVRGEKTVLINFILFLFLTTFSNA